MPLGHGDGDAGYDAFQVSATGRPAGGGFKFTRESPDDGNVEELSNMGKALLVTLKSTFPFVVKIGKTKTRSIWRNNKFSYIVHVS